MTSPRTKVAPYVETELVFINSSPVKPWGVGPNPRVIKRRGDYYMRPRSPISPFGSKVAPISGSHAARFQFDYTKTNVSELQIEPLQFEKVNGQRANHYPSYSDSSEAEDNIGVTTTQLNLQLVPTFNPLDTHASTFSQLLSLDMLPARGLSEADFWPLFSKCMVCSNFMTTRTVPYHVCPPFLCIAGTQSQEQYLDNRTTKGAYFLRLLDTHGLGGASGVPESVFKNIFYVCRQCGRYMTERVSPNHHEDIDLGDLTCINRKSVAVATTAAGPEDTSRAQKNKVRKIAEDFPILEPLYL